MNNLTAPEKKLLNALTRLHDPSVLLGDILNRLIGSTCVAGTPVNSVQADLGIGISGTVADGETLTINNPLVSGVDVYEFVADVAKTKTSASNIAVDINSYAAKATSSLTMDTKPIAGDTVTIGSKTYIFVPAGTANAKGEVSIGASLANSQAALVAAINGTDGLNDPHPSVRAGAFTDNACLVTAIVGGTLGNSIVTTETFTAVTNIFTGLTLDLGSNCPAANAITALVAAITASDTQGVDAADADGDVIGLFSVVAGTLGNNIAVSSTMVNFLIENDRTTMSGGIDGTLSDGMGFMTDGDFLYFSIAENTTADSNWCRIAFDNTF